MHAGFVDLNGDKQMDLALHYAVEGTKVSLYALYLRMGTGFSAVFFESNNGYVTLSSQRKNTMRSVYVCVSQWSEKSGRYLECKYWKWNGSSYRSSGRTYRESR